MLLDLPVIETRVAEDGAYTFRDEAVLGTRMQLMFVAHSFGAAHEAALAVRAEIDRLDLILNSRRADSELTALNRTHTHRASTELFEVVAAAERWLERTQGAFSGRLGRLIDAWRTALTTPDRSMLALHASSISAAHVGLDAASRTITRPDAVRFALDGIAKGWIVERAYQVARAMPGIFGALVDIGGDIRCGGAAPCALGWRVGIADPRLPYDNAPLVATVELQDHGIATSGRGPRDRLIEGSSFSPTLSPFDGWPIARHASASVIAASTADADALATSLLVLPTAQAMALADEHGAAARIETAGSSSVSTGQFAAAPALDSKAQGEPRAPDMWQEGWQALVTFTAPRRQLIRDPQFRSPYMAMWITDLDNNPVRTLILVGKRADWQKDNFIWWSMNRPATIQLVTVRSMSTSGSGTYNVFWDGVDDAGKTVRAGTYVLHVETSRERGKHTYRSLTLDFGKFKRFTEVLPPTEEGGGLRVGFDHY